MSGPRKRRARHAAGRARKMTAVLSVLAFVGIGQAISVAARTATTAGTGVQAQGAVSPSLPSAPKRSASVSAASRTTTAVTTTHAS